MEVVNNFNRELKTLLVSKLPVSRQKMSLVTKSAMKALKFYKHVVQSVEKFVHKCGPDYKVPALYVIDAIVRQSRHQYCEKDVFGPRFLRNIVTTFLALLHCDPKDHPSIIRVLNLWQQNNVFPSELVQSLLQLVANPTNRHIVEETQNQVQKLIGPSKSSTGDMKTSYGASLIQENNNESDLSISHISNQDVNQLGGGLISSVSHLLAKFRSSGQEAAEQIAQLTAMQEKIVEQSVLLAQGQMMDTSVLRELHGLMEELTSRAAQAAVAQEDKRRKEAETVHKVVRNSFIDYDYGDDSSDEGNDGEGATNRKRCESESGGIVVVHPENDMIIDPDLVIQLEQMTETLAQTLALQEELRKARELQEQQDAMVDHDYRQLPVAPKPQPPVKDTNMQVFDYHHSVTERNNDNKSEAIRMSISLEDGEIETDIKAKIEDDNESASSKSSKHKRHNKSRTRSRSRGSRDGSKRRRKESRRQRKDREKERRRKGLPAIRERRVGLISRTIFIGHLQKYTTEAKLLNLVEEFGPVDDFKFFPPRGCAFITFDTRKAAHRAVNRLDATRLDNKEIKAAWAPNRGIKDDEELRQFWIAEEGCTYIPYVRFPSRDAERRHELMAGGGELDEESMSDVLAEEVRVSELEFKAKEEAKFKQQQPMMAMPPMMPGPPPPGFMPPAGMSLPFMPPPPPAFMAAAMQQFGVPPPLPRPPLLPVPPSQPAVSASSGPVSSPQSMPSRPSITGGFGFGNPAERHMMPMPPGMPPFPGMFAGLPRPPFVPHN